MYVLYVPPVRAKLDRKEKNFSKLTCKQAKD